MLCLGGGNAVAMMERVQEEPQWPESRVKELPGNDRGKRPDAQVGLAALKLGVRMGITRRESRTIIRSIRMEQIWSRLLQQNFGMWSAREVLPNETTQELQPPSGRIETSVIAISLASFRTTMNSKKKLNPPSLNILAWRYRLPTTI
jgi:hypothetical protein